MEWDYFSSDIPKNYKCAICGATNCKLWIRQGCEPSLRCAKCAAKEEGASIEDIDAFGYRSVRTYRTYTICDYIPAVPIEADRNYWAHCNLTINHMAWWFRLPTLPKPPA